MSELVDLKEGRISSIRAQAKSPDRVSIYLDGEYAFGAHRDILLEFELRKGLVLGVDVQRKILTRDAFFRARAKAYRLLSFRPRTSREIRLRLEKAGYAPEVADAVVAQMQERGLIDDEQYARNYAESRLHSSGYGPARVRAELRRKGVAASMVEEAVEAVFGERDDVLVKAREMARKKWEILKRESDDRKRRKKLHDYLARRGYSYEMIHQILDELHRGL